MKKLLTISALILFAGIASGQYWHLAGSNLQDYEAGGDPTVSHGTENGGFIESTASEIEGFGTLMTSTRQDKYLGEKIRLTAYVKTENVKDWVGLWMRVDAGMDAISFDNMGDRPITGSSDWEKYEIVLDVPENSTNISYGIILAGTGKAWVDGLQLEKIDKTAGVAFGQDKFAVPDITPAQKHNRTNFQFWIMHAAGINFSKTQGTSPYEYGKYIGNLFAPSWNKEVGFDGFVNGIIYNWETFKSDEDGPMIIKENDDGSVTIEYPIKAWKKFLPEGNSYASFQESMESIRGIGETIAEYMGCTIAQEISQESIIFTINKK